MPFGIPCERVGATTVRARLVGELRCEANMLGEAAGRIELSRKLAVAFAPIADGSVVDAEQSGHLCQLHRLAKVLQEKALFFRPPGSGKWATRQS